MSAFDGFAVLSFDCYGTLVDWETGLLAALAPLLAAAPRPVEPEAALETFARAEAEVEQHHPTLRYRDVLAAVHRRLAEEWGAATNASLDAAFGRSAGEWPVFPDTRAALQALKARFKLAVLSNVDRENFARTAPRLGVSFDAVYTAEDIGSYKPDRRNFDYLVERVRRDFDAGPERLLHVAQSLYHDHAPAKALGLNTCWIDRRAGKPGFGATKAPEAPVTPDFRFPSLAAFAAACT